MRHIFAVAVLVIGGSSLTQGQVPQGWEARGVTPQAYEIGVDPTAAHGGQASGLLKSKAPDPKTGILMQSVKADNYRGQRIRLSGYIKAKNVETYAGLWLRVDGASGEILGYDNMQNRPIRGTTDWKRYEVVLDVPEASGNVAFGILLVRKGQVWVDDVRLDVVGQDVRTTNIEQLIKERRKQREETRRTSKEESEPSLEGWRKMLEKRSVEPVNLDFENFD